MLVTWYSYCLVDGEFYYDFGAGQSFSNEHVCMVMLDAEGNGLLFSI